MSKTRSGGTTRSQRMACTVKAAPMSTLTLGVWASLSWKGEKRCIHPTALPDRPSKGSTSQQRNTSAETR